MPDDAQQQAEDKTRKWMEQHQPASTTPGVFGDPGAQIGDWITNMIAAANAGQFAVSPDLGPRINKQLTDVQHQVAHMRHVAQEAAVDPQFGGGYAARISQFVQQLAVEGEDSAEKTLTKFMDQLDKLKVAIDSSIKNYRDTDHFGGRG
jgi:arginyl-tRNA synthetase